MVFTHRWSSTTVRLISRCCVQEYLHYLDYLLIETTFLARESGFSRKVRRYPISSVHKSLSKIYSISLYTIICYENTSLSSHTLCTHYRNISSPFIHILPIIKMHHVPSHTQYKNILSVSVHVYTHYQNKSYAINQKLISAKIYQLCSTHFMHL